LVSELLWLEADEKADTRPLHQAIASLRAMRITNVAAVRAVAFDWLIFALAERDAAAATEALSAVDDKDILRGGDHIYFPRPFAEGLIARMTNDEHKAQLAFAAARAEQEKIVQAQPDYAFPLCVLGVIDAALGRKEEALREGRRAVELLPVQKDAVDGKLLVMYFAIMAAWVGEKDLACEQLALVTRPPGSGVSYGALKLNPLWDPLRSEPCFEKIVASHRSNPAVVAGVSPALGTTHLSQPARLARQHGSFHNFSRNEPPNPAEYVGERPEMNFSRRGTKEGQNKKRKLSL
jgi:hypothetical protein